MQPSETPSSFSPHHQMHPLGSRNSPYSPASSTGFLKLPGPNFGQPVVRYNDSGSSNTSTPRQNRTGDSPLHHSSQDSHIGSPAGNPQSCAHKSSNTPSYIPLSCSTPDHTNSTWTPRWRNRFQSSPRDGFYSPGRGPHRRGAPVAGAWRHSGPRNRKKRESSHSDCNPGHSRNIQDYILPSFVEDPWKSLIKAEDKSDVNEVP